MEVEKSKILAAMFATMRARGLDPRVAESAEKWAVDQLRRGKVADIENLALRSVTMWRKAWAAADAVVAETQTPKRVTSGPATSAATQASRTIASCFAG